MSKGFEVEDGKNVAFIFFFSTFVFFHLFWYAGQHCPSGEHFYTAAFLIAEKSVPQVDEEGLTDQARSLRQVADGSSE